MDNKQRQNLNLGFVSLFNDLSSEVLTRVLPLYLLIVVQTSFLGIGVVESIAECTATLGRLLSGYYSDRKQQRKPLIFAGYALSVISRPFVLFEPSLLVISLSRFVEKIGKSIRAPPRDALIADLSSNQNRGKNFGINRAMDTLGAVIGLASVFIFLHFKTLSDGAALRTILVWACGVGIVALGILAFGVKEPRREHIVQPKRYKLAWSTLDSSLRFYLLIVFFFALASSSDAFLIVRMRELDFSIKDIFLILTGFNIVSAGAAYPLGKLSDKLGRKFFLLGGWGLYALAYFIFAISASSKVFVSVFLVYGLFYALTDGVEKAMIADFETGDVKAQAYGWLGLIQGLAFIPANLIFAGLYEKVGAHWAFWASSVFAQIGIVLLVFLKSDRKSHGR